MSYTQLYSGRIPQSQPFTKDQVRNNAGGYVFSLDIWQRLRRFLILGSDSNTYYQSAKDLTQENVDVVKDCWAEDPERTAALIREISVSGLAPKQDAGIFALALGTRSTNIRARQATYAIVPEVCRTASTLFQWVHYARHLGKGTGRGMKRAIASWYKKFDTNGLAYQAIKYRNRNNFTHKRLIEFCHQGASGSDLERRHLYLWMRGKRENESLPPIVAAHEEAMALEPQKSSNRLVDLIVTHKLPWEALPTWALTDPKVWEALIPTMGVTALIRNLGNMTLCGAIGPQKWKHVTAKLNKTAIQKARVHPFSILLALSVYRHGRSIKANLYRRGAEEKTWNPVPQVLDALDSAFYMAFKNVDPTNKRLLLALDVSGSMGSQVMNTPITAREASAAMALITMATEPDCTVVGFTTRGGGSGGWSRSRWDSANNILTPLSISPKKRLDDVVRDISGLPFGGTDCALPFIWAKEQKLQFDGTVIFTDNETWHGAIHPVQALREYRQYSGIPTKGIVCAMTSTGFSIADPNDAGMLDICGLDASIPTLISNFIRG